MKFKDKTIIVISQQDWGTMFISKHHYAVELAKLGNRVYFMNSPERNGLLKRGEILIEPTQYEHLYVIKHRLFYPYILKHKAQSLHNFLLKYHIRAILKKIKTKVDIVWSFDYSNTIPLKSFPARAFKIFMPVDEPKDPQSILGAETADIVLSVTNEIIDKYSEYDIPKMNVNHGVSDLFINQFVDMKLHQPIQVGLSGNFLRTDIDWDTLLDIINSNTSVVFHFYGAHTTRGNMLSDTDAQVNPALIELGTMKNVVLHGMVDSFVLSAELKKMDAFLICYDVERDHSGGTNYHKVLEYIATGKVIISNNITTYATAGELVVMPEERHNKRLPEIFNTVINNLDTYNSTESQNIRIEFAKKHTYLNNIITIEKFISEAVTE